MMSDKEKDISKNFFRNISIKKLENLVQKAQTDPSPLIRASQTGCFNNIKLEALAILKQKRRATSENSMKQILEKVITALKQHS